MTCTLHAAWDERLVDYHFGPDHPLAPVRVELTMRLAHEFGLWSQPGVTMAAPAPATDADLQLVHDARYVTNVKTVSRRAEHPKARGGLEETQLRAARMFGLGTEDNPVFTGMHEAPALVAGATLAAARAVWSGSARHGASIVGGMHHAMAAYASGVLRVQRRRGRDRLAAGAGPSGSATSTSTPTTAMGCRPRSVTIRGC